jgi:rhomboid protease GluP
MEHLGPQKPGGTDPLAYERFSPATDDRLGPDDEPGPAKGKPGISPTDVAAFRDELLAATPRVFVSRVLLGACIAVYVLMVLKGVSPFLPTVEDLWKWGADFGPSIALDGQTWRLLTNVFVHVGLLHLAMNMWCLTAFGPLVERLYGNVGFALIYLLAGVGGSIASMGWNPLMTSAGASGAIFGIIGALLAFVLVHRHVIPAPILAPLRSSATAFVGYNLLFGLMTRGIDNAAHIGGLATGFVAGFLMQRRWPATLDRRATLRQVLVGAILAGALGLLFGPLDARIRRNPEAGRVIRQEQAAREFNSTVDQLRPYLSEYDELGRLIARALQKKWSQAKPDTDTAKALVEELESLRSRGERNRQAAESIRTTNPELKSALDHFVSAQQSMGLSLRQLAEAIRDNDATKLNGPGGYSALQARTSQEIQAFGAAMEKYRKDHDLQPDEKPGP